MALARRPESTAPNQCSIIRRGRITARITIALQARVLSVRLCPPLATCGRIIRRPRLHIIFRLITLNVLQLLYGGGRKYHIIQHYKGLTKISKFINCDMDSLLTDYDTLGEKPFNSNKIYERFTEMKILPITGFDIMNESLTIVFA